MITFSCSNGQNPPTPHPRQIKHAANMEVHLHSVSLVRDKSNTCI